MSWTTYHLTLHVMANILASMNLQNFKYDIYPITSSPKKLDNRKKEGQLMSYTNNIATMKWWDQHTKRLKYCSSEKLMNTTINLAKVGHQALTLCLAQIIPPFQH